MTEPLDDPSPRVRRRPRKPLVLAIGLVFLFTPTAAFVAGARATEIENRRLAEFPSLTDGWDFFPKLTTWATDHLPLRDRAVSANTRFSEEVFGEAPQYGGPASSGVGPVAPVPTPLATGRTWPRIVQGKDGWLFFGADFQLPCEPLAPLDETVAGLTRFAQIVQRAGKDYVFTIAPDKSTMNPDKLPSAYVGDDCAPGAKAAFWERMRTAPPTGYIDLKVPLERLQASEGENLWRPSDTHWAPRGALVYAEQLANALDPALWRSSSLVRVAPVQARGDLADQLGTPRRDEVPGWELRREGVTVLEAAPTRFASTTTGAPLWTASTLLLGDSFTQSSRPALAPLFREVRVVQPATAKVDPAALVSAIRSSDTVVLEIVERSVSGGDVPVLDPVFLDALDAALS